MPKGVKRASSYRPVSGLSRPGRPPPKQLPSHVRSPRRRRPAPQCPKAVRRHFWEATGENGTRRGLAEKPSPPRSPREVSVCLGSDRLRNLQAARGVWGLRLARVRWGCGWSRAGPFGQSRAPPAPGFRVASDASCCVWRKLPHVLQPRRASPVIFGVNSDLDTGVTFCTVVSRARFGHVSGVVLTKASVTRAGSGMTFLLRVRPGGGRRARNACFLQTARTPLFGGGMLLSLESRSYQCFENTH